MKAKEKKDPLGVYDDGGGPQNAFAERQRQKQKLNEALLRLQVFIRDFEQGQFQGNTENIKKAFNYRGNDIRLRTKKAGALEEKQSLRDQAAEAFRALVAQMARQLAEEEERKAEEAAMK